MTREVYDIVNNTELEVKEVLDRLSNVLDQDLYGTLLVKANTKEWDKSKAAAQAELDRRGRAEAERLAMKTTRWSVGVGGTVAIVAAIAGAIVGAMLS